MNKLEILISAGLNVDESVGNINAALKKLAKHPSLQHLDVKINVDKSFIRTINSFIESTQKLNVALAQQNRVTQETVNVYRKLDGTVEEVTHQILKSGEEINKSKIIHDENKKKLVEESAAYNRQSDAVDQLKNNIKDLTLAQEKAKKNKYGETVGTSQVYKSDDGSQKLTANYDKDGQLNSYSIIKDIEKNKKEADLFIEQMAQAREKAQINTQNFYRNWEKSQQDHIAKNAELNRKEITNEKQLELDRDKQHYIALQQNRKRQQEYEKTIKDTQLKLASARNQYKDNSNSANSIDGLTNELSRITSVGNYKKAISDVNTKLKEITTTSKKAELQVNALGQQFASAAKKIALWGGISTAIFLPIQGLQNAVQTIIEVNTQMTQLQRVMSDNTDFESMMTSSIELANEYGRSIKDVNENLIGFARMGFNEVDTTALAETTTLLQNISDLKPEESVNTLTAAMTVFNIEADKSIQIADKLNEVNISASLCDNTHVKSLLIDLEFRLVG